ncbi:MAG: hypothetical protein JWL88_383 [Parcubacteria group bacterium]|nr:hypothetical protein [Parcubacteria group bacterium]
MSETGDALKLQLFERFMQAAMSPARLPQLIRYFDKLHDIELTIEDVFEESENSDIISDVFDYLSKEELQQLMRPYLAAVICKTIGAKDVQIIWTE